MALWDNKDVAGKIPKFLPVGRILRINVLTGGTGYVDGSSVAVTIGAPGAGGVQAVATAVVSGGVVQSITLSNPGTKYSTAPAVTMATGTGLTVTVVLEPIVYDSSNIFFVDATEAAQESNKSKGIRGPGWWYIKTYTDGVGDTRYKTECFIAMGTTAAVSGDAEDAVVPDLSIVIAISVQPASAEITSPTSIASFSVTAASTPAGTLAYQWQLALPGSTKYTDISGGTAATLNLTGLTTADDGNRYRCKISTTGAKVLTSNVATLTVNAA